MTFDQDILVIVLTLLPFGLITSLPLQPFVREALWHQSTTKESETTTTSGSRFSVRTTISKIRSRDFFHPWSAVIRLFGFVCIQKHSLSDLFGDGLITTTRSNILRQELGDFQNLRVLLRQLIYNQAISVFRLRTHYLWWIMERSSPVPRPNQTRPRIDRKFPVY